MQSSIEQRVRSVNSTDFALRVGELFQFFNGPVIKTPEIQLRHSDIRFSNIKVHSKRKLTITFGLPTYLKGGKNNHFATQSQTLAFKMSMSTCYESVGFPRRLFHEYLPCNFSALGKMCSVNKQKTKLAYLLA